MSNRTLEVKRTQGWIKYLAVPAAALLLAACSSGLNADVPTTQDELAPQAKSCINRRGNKVKLRNNGKARFFRKTNLIIDARGATIIHRSNPLVANYNKGFLCISGGTYGTKSSLSTSWHHTHPYSGLYFQGTTGRNKAKITIENVAIGVRGKIVGDGVTFKQHNPDWLFKDSYIGRAGDDGVENDRFNDGTVDDVLIDSAFQGVSCRREGRSYVKPRRYNFNIKNSLIALKDRSNDMFKVTTRGKNYCKLNLTNNVFYIPKRDGGKIDRKVINGGKCRNNTIVYTGGSKSYLKYLKRNSSKCFKVTTNKRVWENARNNWFKRHSQFSKYR